MSVQQPGLLQITGDGLILFMNICSCMIPMSRYRLSKIESCDKLAVLHMLFKLSKIELWGKLAVLHMLFEKNLIICKPFTDLWSSQHHL